VPRQALALIIAVAASGCSLSISGPQANRPKGEMPKCDTGKGLVALDSLMAIGFGIGGLAALSEDQGTGAIAIVGAALFTAAALHGSSQADKCRAAFDLYAKETSSPRDDDDAIARRPRRKQRVQDDEPRNDPPARPVVEPPLANRLPSQANDPKPAPPDDVVDPPAKPTPPTKKPPKVPVRTDDWSQFWREVTP
jgi:hypothetical protein